jgi:outer membrane protein assembly factor BamB
MASLDKSIQWPKMRADSRNTGSRIFQLNILPGAPIRHVDTNQINTNNGKPPEAFSLINATPIIGPDGTVYVGSSNFTFYAWTEDGSVYPYRDKPADASIVDSAGCLTSNSKLFFPCGNYSLYCLQVLPVPPPPPSGKFIDDSQGRRSLKNTVSSPSTIDWLEGNVVDDNAGNLFAGCDNFFLFCCNQQDENYFKWGFPTGLFIWSACAFSPDQKALYFVSADMTCYALDPASGKELWEHQIGNLSASSPAVTEDNRVIFGAFDGKIYCLKGSDGSKLWTYHTDSLIYASPALSDQDNRIFVMSSDGVLRALDISGAKPKVVWEFFTGMPGFSSAAIGPDPAGASPYLVYVGCGDGYVYALDSSGRRRWSYDIAAFYQAKAAAESTDPDPAFWPAFRHPAINSSLALGNSGVVTATSGGIILSIPYDAYQHDSSPFFDKSPEDNYFGQLPEKGIRLCYVSPAGRMAKSVLPVKPGPSMPGMPVYAGQTLSFTALSRSSGSPGWRSSFSELPSGLQVLIDGGLYYQWKLSADKTQLHVAPPRPPASQSSFQLQINDGHGAVLGKAEFVYRRVASPPSPEQALAAQYTVQQMSVFSPFIVPALDQLGLATITIPFRFLSIDKNTGNAVAYAYETYSGGASGAPPRSLIYTFTGWYVKGDFNLISGPCYYELTGFPVLLDQLTFSGTLGQASADSAGVSLTAAYTNTLLKQLEWLFTYVTHWADLGSLLPSWNESWKDLSLEGLRKILEALKNLVSGTPTAYTRFATFIIRVVLGELSELFGGSSIFVPWKLFDKKDGFLWIGTYKLTESSGRIAQPAPKRASFSYDSILGNLQVKVRPCAVSDVIGIILLGQNGIPVSLNYTDRNSNPSYNSGDRTITQTLSLLETGLDGDIKLTAVVMVNLDQAEPTFEFSPGWL